MGVNLREFSGQDSAILLHRIRSVMAIRFVMAIRIRFVMASRFAIAVMFQNLLQWLLSLMPCAHPLHRFSLAHVVADYMIERTTPGDRMAAKCANELSKLSNFAGLQGVGNVQKSSSGLVMCKQAKPRSILCSSNI